MSSVYLGQGRLLVSLPWGGLRLIIPADDMSLTPDLALYGMWEPPLTRFILNRVKPGDVVVDVGAHVGYYTILFASLVGATGTVHAFEANPETYRWLADNVALNYFSDRVNASNEAIGATIGKVQLHASSRWSGSTSIHEPQYPRYFQDNVTLREVSQTSIDYSLHDVERIHLLKMDIEGMEYQAFLGMRSMFFAGKVETIIFEWNPEMLQADLVDFQELLVDCVRQLGLSLSLLDESGKMNRIELTELLHHKGIYPYVILNRQSIG